MLPIRTLLHPTDFSEPSHYAFELSCSLARDYDAELIICHVVESLIPYLGEGIVAPAIESYEEEMGENLLRLYPPPGIHAIHLLESGQPVAEILRVAAEAQVDLIVMGTHGRHGLRRMVMGSVAERVMRDASCPVLTLKTPFSPHAVNRNFRIGAVEKTMPTFGMGSYHASHR